jgi:hypothetical protein
MSICCECCVLLSGRGLCDGLITCTEESYRVWCVWVWSWNLEKWGGLGPLGAVEPLKNNNNIIIIIIIIIIWSPLVFTSARGVPFRSTMSLT